MSLAVVALAHLVEQAERDDAVEQRRQMRRRDAQLLGELAGLGGAGVADGVEHAELDRRQQHVVPRETLDRRPHRRRRRRLDVGERPAGARHRVRLLELRVRGVAWLEGHHGMLRRSRPQQDLAEHVVGEQLLLRLAGVGERELGVDHDREALRRRTSATPARTPPAGTGRSRGSRSRGGTRSRATGSSPCRPTSCRSSRAGRARRARTARPGTSAVPTWSNTIRTPAPPVSSRAQPATSPVRLLSTWSAPSASARSTLDVGAGGGEHGRAGVLGELDRRHRHAGTGGVDQHGLAG